MGKERLGHERARLIDKRAMPQFEQQEIPQAEMMLRFTCDMFVDVAADDVGTKVAALAGPAIQQHIVRHLA